MRLAIFGATGRLGSLATMAALAAGHEVVSTLAWTALRPALVTDGEPRGYRLSEHLRPGARVTRADVAQALVDSIRDDTFVRRARSSCPVDSPKDLADSG
jgi:nucleoside-diphosphate-sugar epimerase